MESLTQTEKHLIFDVNDVKLGIEISRVKEVFKTNKIFSLPRTSSIVAGIVNLRGNIITIFNVVELLFNPSKEKNYDFSDKESNIVLVNINNQDIGLLVDQVVHLTSIQEQKEVDLKALKQTKLRLVSAITTVGITSESSAYLVNIDKMMSEYLSDSKSSYSTLEEEDFDDFDYEQYTLPDLQETEEVASPDLSTKKESKKAASSKLSTEKESKDTALPDESVEEEIDDFDYDQYTLPDPEEAKGSTPPEKKPDGENKKESKLDKQEENDKKT